MVVDIDDFNLTSIGVVFVTISGLVAALIAYIVSKRWDTSQNSHRSNADGTPTESDEESEHVKKSLEKLSTKQQSRKAEKWKPGVKGKDAPFEHPWLLTSLKAHTGRITSIDFSGDGKSLVSVGDDRSIMIWKTKDFEQREHKYTRGNVDYDHAKLVRFAPDSKSLITALKKDNKIAVYKLIRKEDGSGLRLQSVENLNFVEQHAHDILSIGIACNGRYIMSSSSDCKIILYDLQGNVLKEMEPKLNRLYCSVLSPCGRFIAASGFTPDVFVWEVQFDRQGAFQNVVRAFELKGHTSGVYGVDFNQNSSRAITVSKDGTWKVFDTDIRFQQGESPHLLASGEWNILRTASSETVSVAIAPSGDNIAIAADRQILMINVLKSEHQFQSIVNMHTDYLTSIRISSCGRFVASSGDRIVRVFHNVPGYESAVCSLEKALKTAQGDAQKRRLDEQLSEARLRLEYMLKK